MSYENENCMNKSLPDFIRLGYAFVPIQHIGKVYTPETAIRQGTIFPELDIGIGEYERGLYDGR